MMGERHRLRPLQMRVAGEDRRLVALRLVGQSAHQGDYALLVTGDGVPQVEL